MDDQNPSDLSAERTAAASGNAPRGRGKRTNAVRSGKSVKKSKKDQLIGLLTKPNGARVSVLGERLQWLPHTVRAALSGLRKQGFQIAASKSAKTGETVYAITGQPASGDDGDGAPA